MKTVSTAHGDVTVLDCRMSLASGYGQYIIAIDIEFGEAKETIKARSTDSSLFDALTDIDSNGERAAYLLEDQAFTIEEAIKDHINNL
jgi:tRNA A-37 threonylcarbamoyl transferase component Bud32